MNTRVCLTVLFLAAAFSVNAQNKRLYGGINLSNVSQAPSGTNASAKTGYQFGADIQLGKRHMYLQPGVQYAATHIGLSQDSSTNKKTDLWVSGVKIPVLLGWKTIVHHSANVRFFTGPSFMAVTGVRHKNGNDPQFILTDKNYHDVEWAWHLGAGLDWKRFFIDLGFQKGLTYVFTGGSTGKSNVAYSSIGIRF